MLAGATSGWYGVRDGANGVRGWGFGAGRWSAQAAAVIDIAAILGLLCIRHPELAEDPHWFVMWPRWWISCYGECASVRARTRIKETLEQTHLSPSLVKCANRHLDPRRFPSPNLPTYYFTRPQSDIRSWGCKWGPDMQKSCWIKSTGRVRAFYSLTWDADTTHPLLLMIYDPPVK